MQSSLMFLSINGSIILPSKKDTLALKRSLFILATSNAFFEMSEAYIVLKLYFLASDIAIHPEPVQISAITGLTNPFFTYFKK